MNRQDNEAAALDGQYWTEFFNESRSYRCGPIGGRRHP